MNAACAFLALVLVACGGKAFTDEIGADGSAGDGAAGDGASGDGSTGDAASDGSRDAASGDAAVDASSTCPERSIQLEMLRTSARRCCPTCNSLQCDHAAPALCCQISYSGANQAAVDEFERALQAFEMQCGPVNCPAIPCAPAPSGVCDPNTSLCR
jgi:hypothetical protein